MMQPHGSDSIEEKERRNSHALHGNEESEECIGHGGEMKKEA